MGKFKKIHFIINPASGTPEPILYFINQELRHAGITWSLDVTQKSGDASTFTNKAIQSGVDAVAVYGGDGSIMEVANTLHQSKVPLAIIPGGTANVLAHDLGLPINSQQAIHELISGNNQLRTIDAGMLNNKPFWIRISTGSFADLITQTSRDAKNSLGKVAYSLSAVKNLNTNALSTYTIEFNHTKIRQKGVALMVANSGHTGLPNLSFTNANSLTDGLLDVLLFKRFDIPALTSLAAKLLTTDNKSNAVVKHWRVKSATINITPQTSLLHDDSPGKATQLNVSVLPKALKVFVPKSS